jgi:hypothetical protein
MFLRKKTKKFNFLRKIQFLCYDVTTWRHNVKCLLVLHFIHEALSYKVQHDMVLYGTFDFKVWLWSEQFLTRSETRKRSRLIGSQNQSAKWQTISYFHTKFGTNMMKATQK